ncbi:hypothetical protein [Curtobacterium sp. CFBP9011]|uniref:hypothetical protein n=1 Tax=Curtobacterium sp. CFBP9011 TaxID=3096530 RepID=UPI002A6AB078|nr:hypothetical protein [Curtobacterium sp. CFBP9011]MDY1005709.1 hypothetical protein [Curtobacterium sp. CFBP9011]
MSQTTADVRPDAATPQLSDYVKFEKLAYAVPTFATLVEVSEDTVRKNIDSGRLAARYPTEAGRKPIIFIEDAVDWLRHLPTEKPQAAA